MRAEGTARCGLGVFGVLKEIIGESLDPHRRISHILVGEEPDTKFWHAYAVGVVAMHTTRSVIGYGTYASLRASQ